MGFVNYPPLFTNINYETGL